MTTQPSSPTERHSPARSRAQSGFTLIELMVAITISLLIMLALVTVFTNLSRNNAEMAKTNVQIENGRFAIQLLQDDIAHAGFWASYVPQFDDLSSRATPALTSVTDGTVPTSVPDPCLEYNLTNWTPEYKANLLGIPVQGYDAVPTSCATVLPNQRADTDVLVVRHADTCAATLPAAPNCEAYAAGNLYFQASLCSSTAQAGGTNTIRLSAASSSNAADYVGKIIRITGGTGKGQSGTIIAYDGATKDATVDTAWPTGKIPDNTSSYSLDALNYIFDTTGHTATNRNCTTIADLRKFVSNIYYIRDHAVTPGDGIPTLMRSQFGLTGPMPALKQQDAVAMIEGIEGFRIEYGIDNVSDRPAAVNYAQPVDWADPANLVSPTNRGDGIPDQYVRCTSAAPCTVAQLTNVVTIKLHVLARSKERSPGYVDTKVYTLAGTTVGPFNDNFKRHVFTSTVRLTNISGRRETP
jgi:prepilin-type N-terminal cleavage/methylation domain-containing protein